MICQKIWLRIAGEETEATLTCYIKEQIEGRENALRKAVIICPGGAYAYVSDREADPVAIQFLAMDVQAFVLNYSIAPHRFPESLLQLAAATAYVRANAADWHIDPNEICIMGFSAGGHLAASLGVFWNREFVHQPLGVEAEQIRPNRLMLAFINLLYNFQTISRGSLTVHQFPLLILCQHGNLMGIIIFMINLGKQRLDIKAKGVIGQVYKIIPFFFSCHSVLSHFSFSRFAFPTLIAIIFF